MTQIPSLEASLLHVSDLKVHFGAKFNPVKAVDGVSLSIAKGETLGLVGESGCGKTTTGMAIVNLLQPTGGRISFFGQDITLLDSLPRERRLALKRQIQIVFQDPFSSLNPRMTLRQMLDQPLRIHGIDRKERADRIGYLLERVGLNATQANRYPHEFSGGQRQRIGIARALALEPQLIVCDEAVSALDVSIQAQIVNLLLDLQDEFGLSYLFISHDLAVVEHIADRVAVMYLGKIVETAPYDELFASPRHPYTQALFSAIPVPDPRRKKKKDVLLGDVPSPFAPPAGCAFHPRCRLAVAKCSSEAPEPVSCNPRHRVACHLAVQSEDSDDAAK